MREFLSIVSLFYMLLELSRLQLVDSSRDKMQLQEGVPAGSWSSIQCQGETKLARHMRQVEDARTESRGCDSGDLEVCGLGDYLIRLAPRSQISCHFFYKVLGNGGRNNSLHGWWGDCHVMDDAGVSTDDEKP